MKVHVLSLILLVAPGYCWWQPLDKSGTSGSTQTTVPPQTREKKEPAIAGSFVAERAGFEPAVGFYPHAALAKRCFRPLSHLSRKVTPNRDRRDPQILPPDLVPDNTPGRV
ncbi:MAG: hypothetical protein JWO38_6156 [Gemmataceae bacterium]|nr:hypothetical protein [Gemmataceae bacterium]